MVRAAPATVIVQSVDAETPANVNTLARFGVPSLPTTFQRIPITCCALEPEGDSIGSFYQDVGDSALERGWASDAAAELIAPNADCDKGHSAGKRGAMPNGVFCGDHRSELVEHHQS